MVRVKPKTAVTIGRAAAAAGLSPKALRLYESRGLLAAPERTATGYRLYSDAQVAQLRFIAAARRLGLHLDQIAEILGSARGGRQPCSTTRAVLDRRISEIDRAIARLTEVRASLRAARDAVDVPAEAGATVCPVIETVPTTVR